MEEPDAADGTGGAGEAASSGPPPMGPIPPSAADAQICWVSHGGEGDLFWFNARGGAWAIAGQGLGIHGLRIESAPTTAE